MREMCVRGMVQFLVSVEDGACDGRSRSHDASAVRCAHGSKNPIAQCVVNHDVRCVCDGSNDPVQRVTRVLSRDDQVRVVPLSESRTPCQLPDVLISSDDARLHLLFETLAYFIAARLYWRAAATGPQPAARDRFLLLGCAVFGAALGSKLLHVLEHLPALVERHDIALWLGGKSVLGGFLGGTLGVELGKRAIGWRAATGDAWVTPIAAGLIVGRIGCQLSGVWDQTYGTVTSLPWGWNYGDGVSRHPVAAYEMLGVAVLWLIVRRRWRDRAAQFAALLLGYCALRFALEYLKPPFGPLAPGTLPVALYARLTAIQWAAIVGMLWYGLLFRRRIALIARTTVNGP
jgi:phosphatidylglycerol---prolipoprotein diacylglyceryl transferase